jgi:hypothetical protein
VELPAGIENATLANCIIGNETLVRDVKLIASCVVGEGVVLFDCGSIVGEAETTFGNGQSVSLGIETGGREVALFAEIDVELAAAVAQSRRQKNFLEDYSAAVAEYANRVRANRTVIDRGARVRSTPSVRNTFVGQHARIDGAALVAETTILSNQEEPVVIGAGSSVTNSLLQWGCRATTMSIVDRSVLTEHSQVEQHARLIGSLLGPNCVVARGEVSSSLVGPFVSMHHESLLLASLWPGGRGNISYGAMAGANHTSKAPDQEFRPGEGAFIGLGAKIRFPADLSRAPYTVVGAGVTTLPQKIFFPFSLINLPAEHYPGVPPAYNELVPGWMLTDNLYALKRNESKFQARNKARRTKFDFRILRLGIVDLMLDACHRLESVRQIKTVYTDRDIEGLGKNYLTEAARKRAIECYRYFVRYYALLKLKDKVEKVLNSDDHRSLDNLLHQADSEVEWEHARKILCDQADIPSAGAGLTRLPDTLEEVARSVEKSKAKDDERGNRIMDDYADAHPPAAQDPIVQQTWAETLRLQREIAELRRRLNLTVKSSKP